MRRVILTTLLILCTTGCGVDSRSGQVSALPEANWALSPATRVDAWQADIDALTRELPKRHKNAFFKCARGEFESAAAELRQSVPRLADHEVVVGLMKLAALIGDAHTSVAAFEAKPGFRRFPIELYNFKDGPVIIAARASQRDLIGTTLLRFAGVPIDEAFRRVSTVHAFENDATYRLNVAAELPVVEIAHAVGLTSSLERVVIDVRDKDGTERSVELTPLADGEAITGPKFDSEKLPISRQKRAQTNWFERLAAHNTVYLRYNACRDAPDLRVSRLCDQVLHAIDRDKARHLIVDLRANGGGNSSLLAPLIWGLKWRSLFGARCDVAVLIGRRTFSSAHMNADQMKRSLGATLIGEPTGQKPNAYGEVKTFRLPQSHMTVRYSTTFWRRADGDPPSMEPDIRIETTSADFFAMRDPVLDAAIERQR